MTDGCMRGSRVAIVVDDDQTRRHIESAVSLSEHLVRVERAVPIVMSSPLSDARSRCRRAGVRWRSLPQPWMDGTFGSWFFFRSLAAKLRRVQPDYIVGIGPHTSVGCALLWRLAGARGFLWYQPAGGPTDGLDPRGVALARARTLRCAARNSAAAAALATHLGQSEFRPRRIGDAAGRPGWQRLVDVLREERPPVASFDLPVVMRSVFPRFVQLHEWALATVRAVRRSGIRRVAIVGDGLRARTAIAAFRDRAIAVTHLIGSDSTALGRPLDGVRRVRLSDALAEGVRCVVFVGPTRLSAQTVRRRARRASVDVRVFGDDGDSFALACDQVAPRVSTELDRRAARTVAALLDAGVRAIQIYGASEVGRLLLRHARKRRIDVAAFADGNRALWGEVVDGVEVVPLAHLTGGTNHRYVIGSLGSVDGIQTALRHAYRETQTVPQVFTL